MARRLPPAIGSTILLPVHTYLLALRGPRLLIVEVEALITLITIGNSKWSLRA